MMARKKIKVKKTRKVKVKKKQREPEDDLATIRELQAEAEAELRSLRKLAETAKGDAEFKKRFDAAAKSHELAVLEGGSDPNYEEFLSQALKRARIQLKALKEQAELQKVEEFRCIAAAGARPPRKRDIPIFITTRELMSIVTALRVHSKFMAVANDKREQLHQIDEDIGKGDLAAYLLRVALEAGIGWATPLAWLHYDLLLETERF